MADALIYRILHRNQQGLDIQILIHDMDYEEGAIARYVDLVGYASVLEVETFNTTENEFAPIIGTKAVIKFRSTNAVNFATFASGEDKRFFVRASYSSNTKFIFTGFLVMDDNQRPYLPPGQPCILSATDNLGNLSDIPLADFNNAVPDFSSKQKLITIICWCLHKTGMHTNFDWVYVACNLFEDNHADRTAAATNCPLNQTYVHVIDYLKTVNEFDNCHTILEGILFSLQARLVQYDNSWWIFRQDEYRNSAFDYTKYTTGGVASTGTIGGTFDKAFDSATGVDLVHASTLERIKRPAKHATINMPYEFPDEILRNSSFLRGTFSFENVTPPTYNAYLPESWTYEKNVPPVGHTNLYYIKVETDSGYEIARYMHLDQTDSTGFYMLRNTVKIPVCEGDKFKFRIDFRYSTDLGGGSGHVTLSQVWFRLFGDDTTFWNLRAHDGFNMTDPEPLWRQSDVNWSTNTSFMAFEGESEEHDFTEWIGIEIESTPIPVTGELEIILINNQTPNSQAKDFSNLDFEYVPKVDGTYKLLDGERYKMYQDGEYSKKFDEDFYLFDPPCKSFRHGMMYLNATYFATTNWMDKAMETYSPADIPASMTTGERFLRWQLFSIWNQIRPIGTKGMGRRVFQFSLHGYDTASGSHAGIIHKYSLQNSITPHSEQSYIIISMRQDWHTCQWTCTAVEILNSADRRSEGTFEFKFIE